MFGWPVGEALSQIVTFTIYICILKIPVFFIFVIILDPLTLTHQASSNRGPWSTSNIRLGNCCRWSRRLFFHLFRSCRAISVQFQLVQSCVSCTCNMQNRAFCTFVKSYQRIFLNGLQSTPHPGQWTPHTRLAFPMIHPFHQQKLLLTNDHHVFQLFTTEPFHLQSSFWITVKNIAEWQQPQSSSICCGQNTSVRHSRHWIWPSTTALLAGIIAMTTKSVTFSFCEEGVKYEDSSS